jgi:hypothetical protein
MSEAYSKEDFLAKAQRRKEEGKERQGPARPGDSSLAILASWRETFS